MVTWSFVNRVWIEEVGLGIRTVAPVVAWSSVTPWRFLSPVVDVDLLGRVKEGVKGFIRKRQIIRGR